MRELTIILFERMGLILIIAFVLTRTRGFRSLVYREFSPGMALVHAFVFGLFGIAGTISGIVLEDGVVVIRDVVWTVTGDQLVVGSSLVAVVIAGLLGGPVVGLGAGIISGGHLMFLGGVGWLANGIVNPLTGLLAGLTARFFSEERVISWMKALFIGVFPPVLQMQMLLILHPESSKIVDVVDKIGLPLVLSNSLAIAIFTAMIGIVLREQENEAALATRKALTIAEEALPFLKHPYTVDMAKGIANLLYDRLQVAAVSVSNREEVLAYKGLASDHHQPGDKIATPLAQKAIRTKSMQVSYTGSELPCEREHCPLKAAIIIPITGTDDVTALIKFYFRKAQHIRPVELVLAEGLGQLISNQLHVIATEDLKAHIRDAELRNLQAQINPHFLFNTLHLIATRIRTDQRGARHITVQLAQYMRFNIGLVSQSLVPLEKECEHVRAYIAILQARFASRLDISFTQAEGLDHVPIPPATIQPLVENGIQHGLEHVANGGWIMVEIKLNNDTVHIAVRDNGRGFSKAILERVGHEPLDLDDQKGGRGLYNVNQRLVSLLGESACLHATNLPSGGSEVYFEIPYHSPSERMVM